MEQLIYDSVRIIGGLFVLYVVFSMGVKSHKVKQREVEVARIEERNATDKKHYKLAAIRILHVFRNGGFISHDNLFSAQRSEFGLADFEWLQIAKRIGCVYNSERKGYIVKDKKEPKPEAKSKK